MNSLYGSGFSLDKHGTKFICRDKNNVTIGCRLMEAHSREKMTVGLEIPLTRENLGDFFVNINVEDTTNI